MNDVTVLLHRWRGGDSGALDSLTPLVYQELKRIASAYIRRESSGHTLQPTALLHEAFLRLVNQDGQDWKNRSHFFGVAAHLMRLILVDHARSKQRAKRGGGAIQVELNEASHISSGRSADVVALDDALGELEKFDGRKARVIELRFFGGLSVEETAEALSVSVATIGREQRMAEAWLQRHMTAPGPDTMSSNAG